MSDIKISFIIPVYNVEKYLQECIDSITKQNCLEIEVILVDDGSTDLSGHICDANRCDFIKVIHKENGGLSSARNAGLKLASGKYISFVDSDDRIASGSISKILRWARDNDADYSFMNIVKFYPSGKVVDMGDDISSNYIRGRKKEDIIKYLSERPKFPAASCSKLYRREFLSANNICFPQDRRLEEDLGFTLKCITLAKSFDCLEFPFYEYRQNREGSITNKVNIQNIQGKQLFLSESCDTLTLNNLPKNQQSKCLMSFVAYEYAVLMFDYSLCKGESRSLAKDVLIKYKWTLSYARTRNIMGIRFLVRILGIDITACIVNRIKLREIKEVG